MRATVQEAEQKVPSGSDDRNRFDQFSVSGFEVDRAVPCTIKTVADLLCRIARKGLWASPRRN